MKIHVFFRGHQDDDYIEIKREYIGRLKRYCDFSVIDYLPEKDEKSYFINVVSSSDDISSEDFSKKIDSIFTQGCSRIIFILSKYGENNELFDFNLRLCGFDTTLDMKFVLLLEQIYRCFKINNGEIYHK